MVRRRRFILYGIVLLFAASDLSAQLYVISTIAGGVPPNTPTHAVDASIGQPLGIAVDVSGNVYFSSDNCIFRVDHSGNLTRFAGTSRAGYTGDGGPATSAQLNNPAGLAFDNGGNLYVVDFGNYVLRKISPSGLITTFAGSSSVSALRVDGTPAVSAGLYSPLGVAVNDAGTVFVTTQLANQVRQVPTSGVLGTTAGNGTIGYSGNGGAAINAQITHPYGIALDQAGDLYVSDPIFSVIRMITPGGIISTVAGPPLHAPTGLAVDSGGNLYIAEQDANRIIKVAPDGTVSTVVGNGTAGFSGEGDLATSAELNGPRGVAVDAQGDIFIADTLNNRIREVTAGGTVLTVAGNGTVSDSGDGGPAANAQFNQPIGMVFDAEGNLFVADSGNSEVREISPSGTVTAVAGNGIAGFSGDNGPAVDAELNLPTSVAVDSTGNLLIADSGNNRIRKVNLASGAITTVAGNGTTSAPYLEGDGGPAIGAVLNHPLAVAADRMGNFYIADTNDNAVRKVSASGVITTLISGGQIPHQGFSAVIYPSALALDSSGDLFVSQSGYALEISAQGVVSHSIYGQQRAVAVEATDSEGNLIVIAYNAVGIVSPAGVFSVIAGSTTASSAGYSGDGGPGLNARLNSLGGLTTDSAGDIYVADAGNNAIRLLQPTNQTALIGAVVNSASEGPGPVSPGDIVLLYGAGLGPSQLTVFQVQNGEIGTSLGGTAVYFDGTAAPLLYASSTMVAAIVPYEVSGATTQVTVIYQGHTSPPFSVPLAASTPAVFTLNESGAGQVAAVNGDGTINTAANPVPIGGYISLYATGEGQTSPPGIDGELATMPIPAPILPVSVTIGGQPALVTYYGGAPGEVAGVIQVNAQIPPGVQPDGYVPVMLKVGNSVSQSGLTIAVSH